MTAKQYRKMRKRKNKYNNRKVEIDGLVFDSLAESRYYQELQLRLNANDILMFRTQPRYMIQKPYEKDGKKVRAIYYIADFEVHHLDGSIETVDVKGAITAVFRIKEKMFNKIYPHKLTLVKWDKGRFVEI